MRFGRFSIAGLLGEVGLCGFGLACLLQASTPWAGAFSVTLGLLAVALMGIIYRTAERRAFWTGFAICGWVYMAMIICPGLRDYTRHRLATTRLLDWAYPWLIPEERQPSGNRSRMRAIRVQGAILGEGLTATNLSSGWVDVWVKNEGETTASFLAGDVQVTGVSSSGTTVTEVVLQVDSNQFARLTALRPVG